MQRYPLDILPMCNDTLVRRPSGAPRSVCLTGAVANRQSTVARTRALLTQNDRKVLAGEKGDQNRQRNVKWEVESRIEDELPKDIELLAEDYPELLEKLREVVCEDS